jgi:hypothetical protein
LYSGCDYPHKSCLIVLHLIVVCLSNN